VGAIVALLHDVLMTVGMFALLGREIHFLTMVGAVLTIAGTRLTTPLSFYDRIREGAWPVDAVVRSNNHLNEI
jgi:preprotein translocase subunit SecF